MPNAEDGQITLAVLGEKMDTVIDKLDVACTRLDKDELAIQAHEVELARNEEQHKAILQAAEELNKNTRRFNTAVSSIESLGAFLGGILIPRG